MLGVPGQVNLTIAPDDSAIALDQDRGVIAVELPLLLRQLRITEVKGRVSGPGISRSKNLSISL